MSTPSSSSSLGPKWVRPDEVMALHKLKLKKKALQARFNIPNNANVQSKHQHTKGQNDLQPGYGESAKRRNPFIRNEDSNKKFKLNDGSMLQQYGDLDASTDATLFKLLNASESSTKGCIAGSAQQDLSFRDILSRFEDDASPATECDSEVKVKDKGKTWIPIDWTLKTKVRFLSLKPFAWSRILKTSEEASGITGFVRCLDTSSTNTTLDTSPNARFHQCCLYWQQPSLPWLKLFPRISGRASETGTSVATTAAIRESLQSAWSDSLRSLFQLLRARQCPYFYVCANTFTILFRAAGVCGISEIQALVTPTTRGFRQILKQEDIEFTMPLKIRPSDQGCDNKGAEKNKENSEQEEEDDDDEPADEEWLTSMGVNAEAIKKINYTQERKQLKVESAVDNSALSLVCIEGVEVQSFYNFLINCKSTTSTTGPLAGVPPTLLAPVAFNGATLKALKVRDSRVNVDNVDYYSLELSNGPVLPHVIHNLCSLHSADSNLTATFANVANTIPFAKVVTRPASNRNERNGDSNGSSTDLLHGSVFFGQENLSDCGLSKNVLKLFCSNESERVQNFECLKYDATAKTYTWS